MSYVSAIIAAGGSGRRMSLNTPKQFYRLGGKTILERSVKPFNDSALINEIIVVTLPEYTLQCRDALNGLKKPLTVVGGGETRQASVYNGLRAADGRCTLAVVHDGARPFVTDKEITDVVTYALQNGCAAVIGTKLSDTVKRVGSDGFVEQTPDRERLWAVQTPQAVPLDVFLKAYKKADELGFLATDDVSLAELIGCPVKVVEGSGSNIKITSDTDLQLARSILGL